MSQDAADSLPPPTGNAAFSAVLLAGGKSSRMGFDKATAVIDGQPLWRRQLATLAALHPQEIFISGKTDGPYVGQGFEIITDLHPDRGPLGGLEAACHRMRTPWLCVLAVDLPAMTAEFLTRLVNAALQIGRGVVPQNDDGFEPLAAVYPRRLLDLISEQLSGADHSLHTLVRRAIARELVGPFPIAEADKPIFRNVNTPGDLRD